MKKYTQLSQDERYEIYATLKSKSSIATLARELGRSRSTIYRELKEILDNVDIELNRQLNLQVKDGTVLHHP
jgi:IS30 family transposase